VERREEEWIDGGACTRFPLSTLRSATTDAQSLKKSTQEQQNGNCTHRHKITLTFTAKELNSSSAQIHRHYYDEILS
jgi:hypothetical protein